MGECDEGEKACGILYTLRCLPPLPDSDSAEECWLRHVMKTRLSKNQYEYIRTSVRSVTDDNTVSRRGEKTSPHLLLELSSRERREFSLYIGVNRGLDRESIA